MLHSASLPPTPNTHTYSKCYKELKHVQYIQSTAICNEESPWGTFVSIAK